MVLVGPNPRRDWWWWRLRRKMALNPVHRQAAVSRLSELHTTGHRLHRQLPWRPAAPVSQKFWRKVCPALVF